MAALRTAVVGTGAIGSLHARIYAEHPYSELVGIVDVNPQTAAAVAEPLGVPWFTEVSDLLSACEFDAASVSVPEHYRYDSAMPLAEAGKHLLLEKPLAPSLAEADRLIADLQETGVLTMVNFILRFDPRYAEAKAAATSGRLGDIHTMFTRRRGSYLGAEIYGVWTDLLISTGIHDLDVMAWLADSPVTRVYAETISRRLADYGHDDSAMVMVRFDNGAIGVLETSWVMPSRLPAGVGCLPGSGWDRRSRLCRQFESWAVDYGRRGIFQARSHPLAGDAGPSRGRPGSISGSLHTLGKGWCGARDHSRNCSTCPGDGGRGQTFRGLPCSRGADSSSRLIEPNPLKSIPGCRPGR